MSRSTKPYLIYSYKEKINQKKWHHLRQQGYDLILTRTMGTDHIDQRIPHENLPDYCSGSVARYTIKHAKKILSKKNLCGLNCLIMGGLGQIGSVIANKMEKEGCKITIYDTQVHERNRLIEFLENPDIIVIAVDGRAKNILTLPNLRVCKNKPVIINPVGRERMIHNHVLKEALNQGFIWGYVVDQELNDRIATHTRVVCTPHIAAKTEDAQYWRAVYWQSLLLKHGIRDEDKYRDKMLIDNLVYQHKKEKRKKNRKNQV